MRLFLNKHYFISVITDRNLKGDTIYSCQIMQLIHGIGMHNASITDDQENIVSSIVHNTFNKCELKTNKLNEVFDFHKECLL